MSYFLSVSFRSTERQTPYPFAKNAIENFALRFTTREFWNAGILADGVGKNSLLLFYYALCFALAIPLGLPRLIYLGFKRKAM